MKILFKNVTKYTKEEMDRFQKFHKNKNATKYKIWVISVGILFISFIILNIMYKNWYSAIGATVMGIIIYMYYFRVNPNRKRENNKNQEAKEFTFCFTDKNLLIKSKKVENKISYFKFHKVYETKTNFYLYIDDEYSLLINKNGFVEGNVNEFRKFIKKKLMFKYRLEKKSAKK